MHIGVSQVASKSQTTTAVKATESGRARIAVDTAASAMAITPDGTTAYVIGQPLPARQNASVAAGKHIEVTPIASQES